MYEHSSNVVAVTALSIPIKGTQLKDLCTASGLDLPVEWCVIKTWFTDLKGAIRFDITDKEIQDALIDQEMEVAEPDDIEVPDDLISKEEIEKLIGTLIMSSFHLLAPHLNFDAI